MCLLQCTHIGVLIEAELPDTLSCNAMELTLRVATLHLTFSFLRAACIPVFSLHQSSAMTTLTGCLPCLGDLGSGSATAAVDLLLFGVGLEFLPLPIDLPRLLAWRFLAPLAGIVFVDEDHECDFVADKHPEFVVVCCR